MYGVYKNLVATIGPIFIVLLGTVLFRAVYARFGQDGCLIAAVVVSGVATGIFALCAIRAKRRRDR